MQGIGHRQLTAHAVPLGGAGLMHQQDGVVDHQSQQDDKADDGEQIHRQRHQQPAQLQRQHAANRGKGQGEQHQQGILEGGKHPPQQHQQDHHGEQEDGPQIVERLLQAVGIAGNAQLATGGQQGTDGGKTAVFQGVDHLLHGHTRRGRYLQADAAPPIGPEDAGRAHVMLHPQQLAKGNDAPGGGGQRHCLQFVRIGGALPHQHDVEPILAIEILADPQAVAKGLDDGGQGGAIPTHFGETSILRHQFELGSGEVETRFGPDLCSRQVLAEDPHAGTGRLIELGQVAPLQQQGDAVLAVKAAKQRPLTAEHPGVGNAYQQLFHQQALQLLDAGLVLGAHANLGAPRVAQDVVVLEGRLFLPLHVGGEAGDQGIDHLFALGLEIDPGVKFIQTSTASRFTSGR